MALDRSFDDGADRPDGKPEQHLRQSASGADAPVPRAEPAEHRSHAEYYEALRAADGKSADSDDGRRAGVDARPDDSGWAAIDAKERPPLDALVVTPERTKHILDGDSHGGGHRHGTGRPGKTEFPANWSDEKITDALVDVARRPDQQPKHQESKNNWVARATRDDVEVVVVIADDGRIWSGWPKAGGPGVVKNPEES
jgi:Bacterial EndoU nuclease